MIMVRDCKHLAAVAVDYAQGQLSAPERAAADQHLQGCPDCRARIERFQEMDGLLGGLRQSFDTPLRSRDALAEDTGRRLGSITSGLPLGEVEAVPAPEPTFTDRLQRHLGAAPWWVISGAFHGLLLLLLTLIGLAVMNQPADDVVIVTNLEQHPPEEKPDPEVKRDVFKNPVEFEAVTDVQTPVVVTHEEVEVADHVESESDVDFESARGDENAISDVPLGGVGTVAALGLGGGGGGAFGQRGGGGRRRLAMKHGGSQKTESAVDAALAWLARNQEPDGNWNSEKHGATGPCDMGMTGLATLAFLGAGHTEKIGKYKDNVKRAVQWLIKHQQDNGCLYKPGEYGKIGYNHAIAGLALAEAAGMARIPETKEAAQKAVAYSVDIHQKGEGSEKQGWRYGPKTSEDISVSGWFIMQIKSAKVAGLAVDPASFDGAIDFLDRVMVEKPKAGDPYSGHRYGYTPGVVKDHNCNTSIGLVGRLFTGTPAEELQGGIDSMMTGPKGVPSWKFAHFYYWYYGTLASFQVGGDAWQKWNEAMKPTLLDSQCKGGDNDGSWDPKGPWVSKTRGGGRVMSTALGAMCLEVYYRYMPLYRK